MANWEPVQVREERCEVTERFLCRVPSDASVQVGSGVATGGHGGTRPPYSAETTRGICAKPKSFSIGGVGVKVVMKSSKSRCYFLENN